MATKSFKIGEYCIGGIIKVEIKKDTVIFQALDYHSKNEVLNFTYSIKDINLRDVWFSLTELTTSYYADKIIDWIKLKIK